MLLLHVFKLADRYPLLGGAIASPVARAETSKEPQSARFAGFLGANKPSTPFFGDAPV
jgi:hypothetical protein